MGYIKHHAIAISSFDKKRIDKVHAYALELFPTLTTPLMSSIVNNIETFFVAPDGSNEDCPDSDEHDDKRFLFIKYIESLAHSDGSNNVKYCEFYFAEDEGRSEIMNHN